MQGVQGRPEGDDWRTVWEFAEENTMSRQRAGALLHDLTRRKKVEMQRGKTGKCWTNFYRPV